MRTIKSAIFINILLYALFLSYSTWYLFNLITAQGFPEIPNPQKYLFISFQIFFHSFFILAAIGLALRKNWGRLLTSVLNIFLSVILIASHISDEIGIGGLNFSGAIASQGAVYVFVKAIPLVCLAVILLNTKTKIYFQGK